MNLLLGIKSDPIENRYSFDWLFQLMKENQVRHLQLGGFFELPFLDDAFFHRLRKQAEDSGVAISSVFTAHREIHGWFSGDRSLEAAARHIYERFIHAGSLLGAEYVGSSVGSVFRDRMESKPAVIQTYLKHMKDLMRLAHDGGLKGLTMEVMSCLAEPPTLPEEIDFFMTELQNHHAAFPGSTVPVFILGDISHGYADQQGNVVHSNEELFLRSIPHMSEFHFKNTDAQFSSTFGFSSAEQRKGIVDLTRFVRLLDDHAAQFPVETLVGYLEHPGPKLGRDYTDHLLGPMLTESIQAIQTVLNRRKP